MLYKCVWYVEETRRRGRYIIIVKQLFEMTH